MRTVKVRLQAADLSSEMAAMREQLDSNGYEATRFKYDQHEDAVVVSVEFTREAAAEAFATRFDDKAGPSSASTPRQLAPATEQAASAASTCDRASSSSPVRPAAASGSSSKP